MSKVLFDECFEYRDGDLIWKKRPPWHFQTDRGMNIFNSLYPETKAGTLNTSSKSATSYTAIEINGKAYKAHRIIWEMMSGPIPTGMIIDHIDGDGMNNKIENLRLVDSKESMRNLPLQKSNKTGVNGVNWHKAAKMWQARIAKNGKRFDLGRFENFDDAVKVRRAAEVRLGFHKNHGRTS